MARLEIDYKRCNRHRTIVLNSESYAKDRYHAIKSFMGLGRGKQIEIETDYNTLISIDAEEVMDIELHLGKGKVPGVKPGGATTKGGI